MSTNYPFTIKTVSPIKCNEKPWDLWVSEIGHSSPLPDDHGAGSFVLPADIEPKGGASRRSSDPHPYKVANRSYSRIRRSGVNRLRSDVMSLHGMFPQMDNLNLAICHMCGLAVKCSAAYRHLVESHGVDADPILPPPPPTVKLKTSHSRSRHKKQIRPLVMPIALETSPVHTAAAPLSRIVLPQPSDLQYLEEASTSAAVSGEMQVCVHSGELPVVSIQDTAELPLGEHMTDDIFAIMNSEGIQSADDITNVADWKNIIRDIGNMQDINFSNTSDKAQPKDRHKTKNRSAHKYSLADADLTNMQYTKQSSSSAMPPTIIDNNMTAQVKNVTTPNNKSHSRSKTSKSKSVKYNTREYDPNKHCGVLTGDVPKPCTRSLTCKAHALSLRRTVEGRSKPFDTLLAEHRASKDPPPAVAATTPVQPPAPTIPTIPPALLVNTTLDLNTFSGLTADQTDMYSSFLNVEDTHSVLEDTSLSSILGQTLPNDYLQDAEAEREEAPLSMSPAPMMPVESKDEIPPTLVPGDVCWYTSCPRPLALCTYNTAHAGSSITLGKKCATIRSNMKSLYSRSQCKNTNTNYYFNQNLTKTVQVNKCNKPEVRKLVVSCGAAKKELPTAFGELFVAPHTVNGHIDERSIKSNKRVHQAPLLDLGYLLDPLLADEKC